MPSGRTHDSITLWSLVPIAGTTYVISHSANVTLLLSAGYLFGGLMFGPDLDVYSQQYRRWGVLRWIWLPYRRALRHRSLWSHGLIVGTIGRLLYLIGLGGLLTLLGLLLWAIALQMLGIPDRSWEIAQQSLNRSLLWLGNSCQHYPTEWLSAIAGLELGAVSHSVSDWLVSAVKRRQRLNRKR